MQVNVFPHPLSYCCLETHFNRLCQFSLKVISTCISHGKSSIFQGCLLTGFLTAMKKCKPQRKCQKYITKNVILLLLSGYLSFAHYFRRNVSSASLLLAALCLLFTFHVMSIIFICQLWRCNKLPFTLCYQSYGISDSTH